MEASEKNFVASLEYASKIGNLRFQLDILMSLGYIKNKENDFNNTTKFF